MPFLSRSRRNRARKSGRGRSRSIVSICEREYSAIASLRGPVQPFPQRLERAKLQLLDRALAPAEPRGGFANAPLVDEPVDDDRALIGRQFVDAAKQAGERFDAVELDVRLRSGADLGQAVAVHDLARGDL